jgi:hypothetical protein
MQNPSANLFPVSTLEVVNMLLCVKPPAHSVILIWLVRTILGVSRGLASKAYYKVKTVVWTPFWPSDTADTRKVAGGINAHTADLTTAWNNDRQWDGRPIRGKFKGVRDLNCPSNQPS